MISFFIQSRVLSAFYLYIAQQLVPLHNGSELKFLLMLIMMLVLKFGHIIEAEVLLRFWRVWSRFWCLSFVEFQKLKFGQANKIWFDFEAVLKIYWSLSSPFLCKIFLLCNEIQPQATELSLAETDKWSGKNWSRPRSLIFFPQQSWSWSSSWSWF